MKRVLLLLLIGIILSAYYIHDRVYYADEVDFFYPLDPKNLSLRNDKYGNGHFGAKRKNGRIHQGVDILASSGDPVMATKSGWAEARFDKDGYGNYVKMRHRGGFESRYGHLEAASMKWIRKVRQGDVIGWVGKSGNARYRSMKPHLHFEIRADGVPVDPISGYMKEPIKR